MIEADAAPAVSLTDHVTPLPAGAHVIGAAFLGECAALALADGTALLGRGETTERIVLHPDAGLLLCAPDTAGGLLTGGDDGRVMRLGVDGAPSLVAEEKGWIDALAVAPGGALAWSSGKKVSARDEKGRMRVFEAPSTARGLAFAPKGYRLAVSHYHGVSLWFPNTQAPAEPLVWKGSHLDVTWSPDARFVVSSMQENTLHGWRLPEKTDMRMSGYPSKTRSLSWSHDGLWLATSGADAAIIWPFADKSGPMGKPPRECGVRPARVTRVAFHPSALVLAVGYDDGCLLLIRLADGAELLVRASRREGGAITALAWDESGRELLFGTAEGEAGLLVLP